MVIDQNKLSPMMKKYMELKAKYKDCLLFFRLGDFYEMFFDDAKTASQVLDLTLTGRDCGLSERAPMCGVPFHAVDVYIRRLIEAGYRVAICEQLNDPATAKGMLERDVVRVVSSGTVMEEEILDEKSSNYLASIYYKPNNIGIAWTDISTGEFNMFDCVGQDVLSTLSNMLSTITPAEIVCNQDFIGVYNKTQYFVFSELKPHCYHDFAYNVQSAEKKILNVFNVQTLKSFECDDKPNAIAAAGGLLEYLEQTQKRSLNQLNKITFFHDNSFMTLDVATRRNLELTERARDGKRQGSLLSVLDKTVSAMGARRIKQFIEQPLQNPTQINNRLNAVEQLVNSRSSREALSDILRQVRDLERLAGRLAYGSASPKDLLSISDTLTAVPEIKAILNNFDDVLLKKINSHLFELERINITLQKALDRDGALSNKNTGFIHAGYDKELDELRNIKNTASTWLENLEYQEKEATGIKTLKIGYNKIFGYYIEVSKSLVDKVPDRYIRKQTLVNGERYITEELKIIEEKILSSEGQVIEIENRIFSELKDLVSSQLDKLQQTADSLATLDAILSFSKVSVSNNYVKPNIGKNVHETHIIEGRHPVVETILDKGSYVSNDTLLDDKDNRTMVITGPNMAGKSTYMRQVALIVLMAHIGCFVPCKEANIALTDRIFTRIGASDDLSGGQSTFMVEMIEVATIINYATKNSLLILDEIGRGTSTFDGLSIAWAVLEYITNNIKAKTLFATHFHELTQLEGLDGVKNYRVLVSQLNDNILFLHKIAPGGASQSFGIEVASLAGITKSVIDRAKSLMRSLEEDSKNRDTNEIILASMNKSKTQQVSLFDEHQSKIEQQIRDLSIDNLTPIQALTILSDLKSQLEENK